MCSVSVDSRVALLFTAVISGAFRSCYNCMVTWMYVCALTVGAVLVKHKALRYVSVDLPPVSCKAGDGGGGVDERERERELEEKLAH